MTRSTRRQILAAVAGVSCWSLLGASRLSASVVTRRVSAPSDLKPGHVGVVAAIRSGDEIDLEDGERVRLAGVEAPKLGTDRSPAWPMAAQASEALGNLILGQRVKLLYPDDNADRWGRTLAHLTIGEDGDWVQGRMLMAGMARVRTFPRTANGARAMLDLERTARASDTGIWSDRFYRIRNPDETWSDLDSVQIVEGRVVDAATVSGTTYLNFGRDWRRDFTFRVQTDPRRAFRRAGIDLEKLTRRRVRGRGWVFPLNGPMIDLTHPEQFEVLEE
jgi:micrococcal nuclease